MTENKIPTACYTNGLMNPVPLFKGPAPEVVFDRMVQTLAKNLLKRLLVDDQNANLMRESALSDEGFKAVKITLIAEVVTISPTEEK